MKQVYTPLSMPARAWRIRSAPERATRALLERLNLWPFLNHVRFCPSKPTLGHFIIIFVSGSTEASMPTRRRSLDIRFNWKNWMSLVFIMGFGQAEILHILSVCGFSSVSQLFSETLTTFFPVLRWHSGFRISIPRPHVTEHWKQKKWHFNRNPAVDMSSAKYLVCNNF